MANANQIYALFPGSNNIEIPTVCDDESLKNHEQELESMGDSINTNILREVVDEERDVLTEAFQEKLRNDRFYLTNLYDDKTRTMLPHADDFKARGDLNDFQVYSQKVEREYLMRDKLEELLKHRKDQTLKILDNNELVDEFVAGKEGSSILQKPSRVRRKLRNLVRHHRPRSVASSSSSVFQLYPLVHTRSESADTQIIDLEKKQNWVIDDDYVYSLGKNDHKLQFEESHLNSRPSRGPKHLLNACERLLPPDLRRNRNHEKYYVQRKLNIRHLQMIAIGASFGVGLFLSSGKALSIGGPFGSVLGFIICASIVLATMLSFTELSTLIPLSSGFSGLASRFVEDAFGFALGWSYWFSFIIALPGQIVASTLMLSYYELIKSHREAIPGFVTLFLVMTVSVNLLDVRILAEIIYGFTFFKILIAVMMIITMIVLNAGGGEQTHPRIGFRYWDSSKSIHGMTYGLFRPTFDLNDLGSGSQNGIGGDKGRFLSLLVVILISSFSFSGVELAFVASGEAINPRKTLPSATKRTFCTIIVLYIVSIFVVSLNIYSGDYRLLRYYTTEDEITRDMSSLKSSTLWEIDQVCSKDYAFSLQDLTNGNQSPWVLALQSFGLCSFSSVFNGILVFFGVSAGCSSLYASSRTLYSMAIQGKAPQMFRICSKRGVPFVSVLFSGLFGFLAYLVVDTTSLETFQALANISSATTSIIWIGLNVSFLRFYYALKKRSGIISRDDPTFPYRSPFQPFLASYGLLGSILIVLLMGFTNFLSGFWNTKMFFSSYGGLIFFSACYIGYKVFGTSKIQKLDQLDMDSGRREMDRMIWTEHNEYSNTIREQIKHIVTWMF